MNLSNTSYKNETLKKILLISEGQIGDLLLLTPTIKAIKKNLPKINLVLLVLQRNPQLVSSKGKKQINKVLFQDNNFVFSKNPYIDDIYIVKHFKLKKMHLLQRLYSEFSVIKFIRNKDFHTIIVGFPNDRFLFWAYFSNAKRRIGTNKNIFKYLLTDRIKISREDKGVLKYYTLLLTPLNIKVKTFKTDYFIPDETLIWSKNFFNHNKISIDDTVISIHPGASGNYKIWPPENYAELIDKLMGKGIKVILCGGIFDEPIISEILKTVNCKPILLKTGTNLDKLAGVFSFSDLCITNDSGPRHLAIAVGSKSLAIFRKHHTKAWRIYSEGKNIKSLTTSQICKTCPSDKCLNLIPGTFEYGSICIRQINVDTVFNEAIKMTKIESVYKEKRHKFAISY